MRRGPLVVGGVVVVAGGIAAWLALHRESTSSPTHAPYVRARPPASATAFSAGGTPLADAAIERALGPALTELEIALDRGQAPQAPAALTAALDARPTIAPAWRELLAIAVNPDASALILRHAGAALSDRFAAAGLGYFVDATAFGGRNGTRRHVAIHAYRIDEIRMIANAEPPARVIVVHRLDGLGFSPSLFGMQSEDLGGAVVLSDQIVDYTMRQYVELLAPGAPYKLDDRGWWAKRGAKVAAAAGEALRGELLAALRPDDRAAAQIGALAAERTKQLGDWPTHYQHFAHANRLLDGPFIPEAYVAELARTESGPTAERVLAIENALGTLAADRIAARTVDLFTAAVARHEAQHALDAARATPLPVPQAVLDVTQPEPDADAAASPDPATSAGSVAGSGSDPTDTARGFVPDPDDPDPPAAQFARPVIGQTHVELSAYVSQLASEPAIPHLVFWAVARNAFDGRSSGHAEAYVAALLLEGLARHLGIPTDRPADHDRFDRQYLGAIAIALSQRSGADLRTAAAALWQDLYGEPYATVTLR